MPPFGGSRSSSIRKIDSAWTRRFFELIESPDKKLVEYEGHFHALLLDVGRDRVLADIADWILERSPGR